MISMTALQIKKIDSLLKELPEEKFQLAINFILWLNQTDEVFSTDEIQKIKKAKKEKGGISWKKLRENV
ncbi:MAG: hypothetical protein KBF93_24140 [Leptospiraceae bacterium]|nr:hypothetical protein [Leptospiraceae bacterium]